MIVIRGKRDRVYLILQPEMKEALDLLTKCWTAVGIDQDNIFLFPRSMGADFLNGCKCMADILEKVEGLEYPEQIRSTTHRMYIATVVQVNLQYQIFILCVEPPYYLSLVDYYAVISTD